MIEKESRLSLATLAAIMFLTIAFAPRAEATTVADYRARVSEAAGAMRGLATADNHAYAGDITQREAFIAATLARVLNRLPAKETVSLGGQNVEVDNAWLHTELAEYERIKNHRQRSAELFRRTGERLQALLQRLDEMKSATAEADKDDSKARLAEILRRPEYDKSAAEGSALGRLWERFLRWLAKLFPKTSPLQPGTGRALSQVAQVVVITLALALIVFLIWKFLPRFLGNRGKKKTKREARIVLGERLEPDQTAADLLEQADALARAGDLRGAIRKAYIAFLCELGDRKVISLAQHKTNRDYLMSVRHKTPLYQAMHKLTASFELHWYGFVPPAANDWTEFSAGIRTASGSDGF